MASSGIDCCLPSLRKVMAPVRLVELDLEAVVGHDLLGQDDRFRGDCRHQGQQ